ncbi:MFS transporter [Herbiconiux sp. L3-i23]|uniref:MFS transporter n=1 Tax=Herbiconiux sp. L3-i23 TaxID=2905871 RepID=UPI00206CA324|nr:MFS transporter [Herbiconiux sp. L3-i23]BDI21950.1 putative transporter [Herbiconiux sp. L3-i23]
MLESRLPSALQPFTIAQYRRLVLGLTLSLLGAGVWVVALVWQVIALGGGPVDLSIVATASAVGMVVTVLFGGALADRIPQKYILVAVEAVKATAIGTAAGLSLSGTLEVWHLAVVAFVYGVTEGFFYPAYSAWLPSLLPAEQLLAANGVEGVLRPTIMQAGGPALAGALLAFAPPGVALCVIAGSQVLAAVVLASMATTPVRREKSETAMHPLRATFLDIGEGFRYMVKTSWLFATLIFACLMILVVMGPIEVLLPFAVRDQTGGGAGAFALVLACFGIGGAIGSIVVASLPLPRRYLTLMNLLWGAGCIPLVVIGYTDQLWLMAVAVFITGFTFQAASVIWGTLLQRRVPAAMLGRVSSLDFFVSIALMPVSMALAGPVGEAIGVPVTFVVAALVPTVLAVATILIARLPQDEIRNPLDRAPSKATSMTDTGTDAGEPPPPGGAQS